MTEENLKLELERAYRCIVCFIKANDAYRRPAKVALNYHAPTIAAAKRFVVDGALDGSDYFNGKSVDVLQDALKL